MTINVMGWGGRLRFLQAKGARERSPPGEADVHMEEMAHGPRSIFYPHESCMEVTAY